MSKTVRKYVVCLVFSFDLLLLVWLSEMLRYVIVGFAFSSNPYTFLNISLFFLFVFGIVPLSVLGLWLINPFAIKKLLVTFGLAEESVGEKKKSKEVKKESEEGTKKGHNLILSKWLYYILIAILLLIFIASTSYGASLGIEMAARFLPTFVGLFVTLVIFWIFFDLREDLEWKEVEDRVKKRIGREIFSLFTILTYFCEVDKILVGDIHNKERWKELERKQLKQMMDKVVLNERVVNDLLEKTNLALDYASLFESNRTRISEIEGKYGRFLNPKLRTSLMDIQDYLGNLRFQLKVGSFGSAEKLSESLSKIIEKIVKEIDSIRKSGIDIGP